jgi:hypothetical protein
VPSMCLYFKAVADLKEKEHPCNAPGRTNHSILVFCWADHDGSHRYDKECGNSPYELLSGLQAGKMHSYSITNMSSIYSNKTTVSTATVTITPSFA